MCFYRAKSSPLEILRHAVANILVSFCHHRCWLSGIATRAAPLFHLSSDLRPVVFIPINTLSMGVHNALLAGAALHRQNFTREWVSNKPSNIPTFLITVERPSCVLLIYLIQSTAAEQMPLKWLRVTDKHKKYSFETDTFFRMSLILKPMKWF